MKPFVEDTSLMEIIRSKLIKKKVAKNAVIISYMTYATKNHGSSLEEFMKIILHL